jgi:hypothetical protein
MIMKTIAAAFALVSGALLATAVSAAPLTVSRSVIPDTDVQNVRLVCNENGRCWRERGNRRVIIRNSYGYAPRQRHIERREYYSDEPRAGIGFRTRGVSVGIGVDRDRRW